MIWFVQRFLEAMTIGNQTTSTQRCLPMTVAINQPLYRVDEQVGRGWENLKLFAYFAVKELYLDIPTVNWKNVKQFVVFIVSKMYSDVSTFAI